MSQLTIDAVRSIHKARNSSWILNFLVKVFFHISTLLIAWPIFAIVLLVKFVISQLFSGQISDFPDRHVVVTGCDSGFGRLTAIALAKLGLQVHAAVFLESSVGDLKAEFGEPNLHIDLLNVTSDESVERYGAELKRKLGGKPLWALINNAGQSGATIDEQFLEIEDYSRIMDVNVYGSIRMVHLCRPLMDRKQGGRLIFMLSATSYYFIPYGAPYMTSKIALRGYVNALSLELNNSPITVHSCTGGFFPTPMMLSYADQSVQAAVAERKPEIRELFTPEILERRISSLKLMCKSAILDNRMSDVVDVLVNAVISTRPGGDVWVCWNWLIIKALSMYSSEMAVQRVGMGMKSMGDVSFDEILDQHEERTRKKEEEKGKSD